MSTQYFYGFKLLSPDGCTEQRHWDGSIDDRQGKGPHSPYNLPGLNEKWRATRHPRALSPDRNRAPELRKTSCGLGRIHVHQYLTSDSAPETYQVWFARIKAQNLIGRNFDNKYMAAEIELRRIRPEVLARWIALGLLDETSQMDRLRLDNIWIRGWNLKGVSLSRSSFRTSSFTRCHFDGVTFESADLYHTDFCNCTFSNCYFDSAVLENTRFRDCTFTATVTFKRGMSECSFQRCIFQGTTFDRVIARGCRIHDCTGWLDIDEALFIECSFAFIRYDLLQARRIRIFDSSFTPSEDETDRPVTEVIQALRDPSNHARNLPDVTYSAADEANRRLQALLNTPINEESDNG